MDEQFLGEGALLKMSRIYKNVKIFLHFCKNRHKKIAEPKRQLSYQSYRIVSIHSQRREI
jgi:hypothetical protein